MRKLVLAILFILLLPSNALCDWSLISNVAANSSDGLAVTTSAINTTNADEIVIVVSYLSSRLYNPTDNKSNSWTKVAQKESASPTDVAIAIFLCDKPCIVGTNHTFSAGQSLGLNNYPAVVVLAVSGSKTTSPFDQVSAGTQNIIASTTIQPGTLTPNESGELVITGLTTHTNAGTASINSSYSITNQVGPTANSFGSALGYIIQTSASATNPTWTYSSTLFSAAIAISLKVQPASFAPAIINSVRQY